MYRKNDELFLTGKSVFEKDLMIEIFINMYCFNDKFDRTSKGRKTKNLLKL